MVEYIVYVHEKTFPAVSNNLFWWDIDLNQLRSISILD